MYLRHIELELRVTGINLLYSIIYILCRAKLHNIEVVMFQNLIKSVFDTQTTGVILHQL